MGELTLNMDGGRMGQTGKVTRSPWKCVCVCVHVYATVVSEAKLERSSATGM